MARYLFPQDRLVFRYGAPGTPLYSPQSETLTIYTDQAATTPANLLDPEGGSIDNVLDIGADCLIPEFQGPDNATTVWAKTRTNQVYPLYAQTGQFVSGSGTLAVVNTVNGQSGTVTVSPASIGAYTAAAGGVLDDRLDAVEGNRLLNTNNLADVQTPSIARTSLGLGSAATRAVGTASGDVAAGDAPASAVATHTAASDPHGDRAFTTSAISAHVAAADPHGDRAVSLLKTQNLADLPSPATARTSLGLGGAAVLSVGTTAGTVAAGDDSRMTNARTPTAHAATHAAAGSDPVTLTQAQITGLAAALAALLPLAGGTITGALTVEGYTTLQGGQFNGAVAAFGDLSLIGTGKAYRMRRGGGGLDFEGGGADMVLSNWSAGDFTGTQHSYIRFSSDAQNMQVAGKVEFVDGLYGTARHVLDGAANQVGFYGAAPASKPTVTGSRADGTALQSLLTALATLGLITDSTTA